MSVELQFVGYRGTYQGVELSIYDHSRYDNSQELAFHAYCHESEMLFLLAGSFGVNCEKKLPATFAAKFIPKNSGFVYFNNRDFYDFIYLLLQDCEEIKHRTTALMTVRESLEKHFT